MLKPDKRSSKLSPSTDKFFKRLNKTSIEKKIKILGRESGSMVLFVDQIIPTVIFYSTNILLTHQELQSFEILLILDHPNLIDMLKAVI